MIEPMMDYGFRRDDDFFDKAVLLFADENEYDQALNYPSP